MPTPNESVLSKHASAPTRNASAPTRNASGADEERQRADENAAPSVSPRGYENWASSRSERLAPPLPETAGRALV